MSDEPVPHTRFYVRCRDGDFVLEVPSDWKLTFGAVNPGSPPHGHDLHCLRVWGGTNSKTAPLKAVFCNVSGFRDLSLPLARKVSKETGSTEWTRDDDQTLFESKRQLTSEWTDSRPDDIPF